jgi:transcriptional regulator with XRE-family HTH domain
MSQTTYDAFVQDPENRRIFEQEALAMEATELVSILMAKREFNKADLARQIGKSKAFVTQLLRGSRNMTMHTLADLAFALGHKITLEAAPLRSAAASRPQMFSVPRSNMRYREARPATSESCKLTQAPDQNSYAA